MSDSAPKKPLKSTPTGTVFDVKRPGRIQVQPTSRPVIVGHKPVVRDPLTTANTSQALAPKPKPKIEPVTLKSSPEPPAAAPSAPTPATAAATPELAAVADELAWQTEKPESETPTTDTPTNEKSDPAVVSAPATDAATDASKDFIPGSGAPIIPQEPPKKQVPLSPELKREMEEEVRKNPAAPDPDGIVVAGEHGPINFVKVFFWFLSVIVLVVIVGDLLLDAGTITTSVSIPHTHFIK